MASLEYQLNPFIFAKEVPNLSLSQHDVFRSQQYLDSHYQLEMLLSQYFDKVLKKLVYKFKYKFNANCKLLGILFQHSYKYDLIH